MAKAMLIDPNLLRDRLGVINVPNSMSLVASIVSMATDLVATELGHLSFDMAMTEDLYRLPDELKLVDNALVIRMSNGIVSEGSVKVFHSRSLSGTWTEVTEELVIHESAGLVYLYNTAVMSGFLKVTALTGLRSEAIGSYTVCVDVPSLIQLYATSRATDLFYSKDPGRQDVLLESCVDWGSVVRSFPYALRPIKSYMVGVADIPVYSNTAQYVSGVIAYAGTPVYLDGNERLIKDIATRQSGLRSCLGLILTDIAIGGSVSVVTDGTITLPDWTEITGSETLVPGETYYLSQEVSGTLDTMVSQLGTVIRVGYASSENDFVVNISRLMG